LAYRLSSFWTRMNDPTLLAARCPRRGSVESPWDGPAGLDETTPRSLRSLPRGASVPWDGPAGLTCRCEAAGDRVALPCVTPGSSAALSRRAVTVSAWHRGADVVARLLAARSPGAFVILSLVGHGAVPALLGALNNASAAEDYSRAVLVARARPRRGRGDAAAARDDAIRYGRRRPR
jgi:hypothetical protein